MRLTKFFVYNNVIKRTMMSDNTILQENKPIHAKPPVVNDYEIAKVHENNPIPTPLTLDELNIPSSTQPIVSINTPTYTTIDIPKVNHDLYEFNKTMRNSTSNVPQSNRDSFDGNATMDELPNMTSQPLEYPLSKESQKIEAIIFGIGQNAAKYNELRGRNLEHSQALADEAHLGLKKLDAAEKYYNFTSWLKKNLFYFTAGSLFIAYMCFRMYQMGSIPVPNPEKTANALSKAAKTILDFGNDPKTIDDPVQGIIKTAVENPIMPVAMVTLFGAAHIIRITFKAIRFIFK